MRVFPLIVLIAGAAVSARAQSTATLRGIDVYRSTILTESEVHKRFGERLKQYVAFRNQSLPGGDEKAEALRVEMEQEVAAMPGIKNIELHVSQYFTSTDHAMYAMFDVVDATDASRMNFTAPPEGIFRDPDGVLSLWRSYVAIGEALSRRGQLSYDRPNCPGYYCLWGGTPELDENQRIFAAVAKKRSRELREIFRQDAEGGVRADALFILSYSTSGADVVYLCREGLVDSDARVRGAALQVLADIANHHPEYPIALERVLLRLDDPSATVRGKAMGLLVPLAEREMYATVMITAATRLVSLLKLSQPESSVLAYTLVGMLSKKHYDRMDFSNWDAWARKAAKGHSF